MPTWPFIQMPILPFELSGSVKQLFKDEVWMKQKKNNLKSLTIKMSFYEKNADDSAQKYNLDDLVLFA